MAEKPRRPKEEVSGFTSEELLTELQVRGGATGELARAALLAMRKAEDYHAGDGNPDEKRDIYFPFGLPSYSQMIHTKSARLTSLARSPTMDAKAGFVAAREANFEGALDTCLDLINYASFAAEWLRRNA